MLDRDEDMLVTGGRHPFYGKYKVGFLSSGKVVALDVSYYSNAGHSVDLSLSIMERALFHMENSYSVANVRGRGYVCRTNLPTNTAFRGFGGPQGMMVSENWITDVAQSLGRPAEEVRRLNLYVEGEATPYNQVLDQLTLDRCWDECLQRSRYQQRRDAAELFNRQNRWTKRGVAIVPTKFGISFTAAFLNQAGALVHIYTDGSVLLTHGGTKMVQVASRVLGIPCSKIHISETSTNTVPNTSPTAASASSDLNGAAVFAVCRTLSGRLVLYQTQNSKASWEDWRSSSKPRRQTHRPKTPEDKDKGVPAGAGALVHIYTDGSVLLTHGGTKMVQVASRVLGIPCSKIHISETSTNTVPNTSPTAASVSSDLNGAAVFAVCRTLSGRLVLYQTQNSKASWEDWRSSSKPRRQTHRPKTPEDKDKGVPAGVRFQVNDFL
ncbi:xanthine dehydrogenase/oxidase-like [Perca fluviatilis]|uniref:xanthine dehydrogenase/oxidase-like n=1 Tax=Perca fluviatilis TaxID=8168 RepID=UPI001962A2F3|nr:xanthine dehydrogenase/oxidase-like [Perca fluviatilis]